VPEASAVRELTRAGFNRVSLGVQSFSNARLKALGRLHTAADAVDAFSRLRNGGFRNIGLDLIWGLPGQRPRSWMDDLRYATDLGPEHISCYALTLEPGTPLAARYDAPGKDDRGKETPAPAQPPDMLPDEDEQARMYVYGMEYLLSQGYLHYEISNTARLGFACRHNEGYWSGKDYLGLGPAAVSTVRGQRWTNSADHAQWRTDVEQGAIGNTAEHIDAKKRLFETVMLRLRTAKGPPFAPYPERSGRGFLRDHGLLARLLTEKGLMRLRNRHARLTLTGMLVSNSIIERIFERMETLAQD
jgi:oxygen-independent coproporphyrinogen-3 oxidase